MELHPCTVSLGAGVHIWVGERIGRSLLLLLCHHHHHLLLLLLLLLLLEHEGMLLLLHDSYLHVPGCGNGILEVLNGSYIGYTGPDDRLVV